MSLAIFSLDSGSLPDGLSLASDGTISGTPTTAQTSTFVVRVQYPPDNVDCLATASIIINPAPPGDFLADLVWTLFAGISNGTPGVDWTTTLAGPGGDLNIPSGSQPGGTYCTYLASGNNAYGVDKTVRVTVSITHDSHVPYGSSSSFDSETFGGWEQHSIQANNYGGPDTITYDYLVHPGFFQIEFEAFAGHAANFVVGTLSMIIL